MASIKYAVWFHGTRDESEGICYMGKNPYIVDEKHLAEEHKDMLQYNVDEPNKFSVCMLIVDEV